MKKENDLRIMFNSEGWDIYRTYWQAEIKSIRNDLEKLDDIKEIKKAQGRIDAIRTMLCPDTNFHLICQD